MAKSLGTLTLDLVAKVGGFEAGMDKASRVSEKRMKEIKRHAEMAGKAIGALAVAGGAALVAMTVNTVNAAREISNLSKVANTSSAEFQRLAFAAQRYGVQQDKLADILKDTSDKVGEFLNTGGGPLIDFFKTVAPQVGVTAEQFRKLSGPEALQLYTSSLEKANLSQAETTFFMEALASDATLLLPLLRDNGKEMGVLGKQAEAFGAVLSDIEIKQLEQIRAGIDDMQAAFKGASNQIVLEFLPTMRDLTDLLKDPETIRGIAAIVSGIGEIAAVSVKAAAAVGWLGKNAGEGLARAIHGPDTALGKLHETLVDAVEEYQALEALLKNTSVNGVSSLSPAEIEETTARIAKLKDIATKASEAIDALNETGPTPKSEPKSGPIPTEAHSFTPARKPSLDNAAAPFFDRDMMEQQRLVWLEFDMLAGGAIETLEKVADKSKATTTELDQFSLQAARNMQSHLADFLFDPFEDGLKGMAEGFARTVQRMLADAAAAQVAKALIGDFGTTGKAGGVWGAIKGAVMGNANGNAFAGGRVQAFADGGILDRPTFFGHAGGLAVGGEAGTEAIMPLKRGPDGKLGVAGGGGVVVTINQHIDARGQGEAAATSIRNSGRDLATQIETTIVANVARRGSIYQAMRR